MLETENLSLILCSLRFAATKHRDQRRKDREASPYINHPKAQSMTPLLILFRVCIAESP